ncbi:MAG: hypothetical protein ACP5K2_02945 [bacterium]
MKRFKSILEILMILFLFIFSNTPLSLSNQILVSDDESIYIIANSKGSIKKTIVVDWLRIEGKGNYTIYDSASSLRNVKKLLGDGTITVSSDRVKIEGRVNGISDIYYRGETDKKPPVSLSINYYLNKKMVQYKDAKDKGGTLRVEFILKNASLNRVKIKDNIEDIYTPFTVIITANFPASKIRDIKVSNGGTVTSAGSNITVNIMGMPQPEFKGWIEISMDKINLDSLQILIIPSSPTIAGILSSLKEYMGGIEQIDQILKFQQDLLKQMAREIGDTINNKNPEESLDNIDKIKDRIDTQMKTLDNLEKNLDKLIKRNKKMLELAKEKGSNENLLSLLEEEKRDLDSMKLSIKSLKDSSLEMYKLSSDIPLDSIRSILASLSRISMSLNAVAEGGVVGFVMIPGLNMVREGIKTAKSELEKSKEKMDIMERLAKSYDSFIGKPSDTKKSSIKFVYYIKFE